MDLEEEILVDDDQDVLDILVFNFPRRRHERPNYFHEMDDLGFFRRFRLTKETALHVLTLIEEQLEFNNNLNNSVSPINQLLTALLFYSCGGHQINIGDIMHMNQSTVSRIIKKVSEAIAGLKEQFINMPRTEEERIICQNNFFDIAEFPRVLGCIDCTHIKIKSPGGEDGEIFRNRKGFFSINVQLVCNADNKITNVVARWPGSTHDATIFSNSRLRIRFEAGEFGNSVLLGDSGYPVKPYLLTPLGQIETQAEQRYNQCHIRTRNIIERTNGILKRRFPCLAYGLRCKINTALTVIVATSILHNVASDMDNGVPPPPFGINMEELEYLIEQGNIPPNNPRDVLIAHAQDYRNDLINNYFANRNN